MGQILTDKPRPETCHGIDAKTKDKRQQQAWNDAGNKEIADRLLCQQPVKDQQQAGRDEHAQNRGAGDDADGKPFGIAVAHHFGHCNTGEYGRRCNGNAGDGREDRIGPDRSYPKTAAYPPEHLVGDIKGITSHPRHGDDIAHQNEERHDAKKVA